MKDEEFRKWFHSLIEWEPFPTDRARELLDRILKILFGYRSQLLLEDQEMKKKNIAGEKIAITKEMKNAVIEKSSAAKDEKKEALQDSS